MEVILNVITLNCWSIPGISKNRKERIKAIAEYLFHSAHNIICLQEIWSEDDYFSIRDIIKSNLPHSHYFYSGVFGSGLCVFSKWTIQDIFFHQWPLNGYIHKIHHGDWFGGKGVGLCRIKCADWLINVYCTHLHAEYHKDDIYLAHRMLQAYSTAEFVKLTKYCSDISILAGDLNTAPGDLSFRLITEVPSLKDPYNVVCNGNIGKNKYLGTSECANNSYTDPVAGKLSPEGKRIDHILYDSNYEVEVLELGNPLEDRVPGKAFSYSDHNAVSLKMKVDFRNKVKSSPQNEYSDLQNSILEAIKVCKEAISTVKKTRKFYLAVSTLIFLFILATVGCFTNNLVYVLLKIFTTFMFFFCIIMGTFWNNIEMNSLRAGISGLENVIKNKANFEHSNQSIGCL